jgi:hypothetical protein
MSFYQQPRTGTVKLKKSSLPLFFKLLAYILKKKLFSQPISRTACQRR